MTKGAYYNEIDPFAAAWLRELIKSGHIADGEVDERSIEDVCPDDLAAFTQCHFFAGVGVWSLALRQARWSDDRPVWTGSCPCQPFSAAGKGGGFADERHIWPAFFHLIEQCRPVTVLGEQVASKDGLAWLDLVQADLEGAGYASGAVDTCAAGFGAPHIRQRLYWVADALRDGAQHRPGQGLGAEAALDCGDRGLPGERLWAGIESPSGRLADASSLGRERWWAGETSIEPGTLERSERLRDAGRLGHSVSEGLERHGRDGDESGQPGWLGTGAAGSTASAGTTGQLDDTSSSRHIRTFGNTKSDPRDEARLRLSDTGCETGRLADANCDGREPGREIRSDGQEHDAQHGGSESRAGPTNGFWRDPDWLFCRDEKWRPVESGTFPLAHAGAFRNRVAELRGAGNAINVAQAQGFIEAVTECLL